MYSLVKAGMTNDFSLRQYFLFVCVLSIDHC